MSLKITGKGKVLANMRRIAKKDGAFAKEAARKIKIGGLFIQRISQEVVPIDQDILRLTARTRNIGGSGFDVDVVISYGTNYAVYVHENLEARHKPGKQAKYLEAPIRKRRKEIFSVIANA